MKTYGVVTRTIWKLMAVIFVGVGSLFVAPATFVPLAVGAMVWFTKSVRQDMRRGEAVPLPQAQFDRVEELHANIRRVGGRTDGRSPSARGRAE